VVTPFGWTSAPPTEPGWYEVRMRADAWELYGPGPARLVKVDTETRRFDAVMFGGDIDADLWEWRKTDNPLAHMEERGVWPD
jgi:hypothetical protein